ncbi:hypothetical protein NECAME_02410 [Necator americanus]|uniref:CX domain-containing protein n=1 Tax=Necator americanus TaxID=51031 RepID=W2TEP8_NECAM|nr:hypothetical protein NECAME_02410 [Necator americanus]ETN80278.1 hypothetical protein NECAME_02410 [Necator americanus]
MAADRSSPWSRWDVPAWNNLKMCFFPTNSARWLCVSYVLCSGDFGPSPQYDSGINRVQYDTGVSNAITSQSQSLIRSALVDQKINTIDPSFYDCVYSTTMGQTIIERCYKDIGCCATTCCSNDDWKNKYGWAVALIVVFCILVIIAVVIWMIVWLINRSKDKKQKRLLEDSGLSRATSNLVNGRGWTSTVGNPAVLMKCHSLSRHRMDIILEQVPTSHLQGPDIDIEPSEDLTICPPTGHEETDTFL